MSTIGNQIYGEAEQTGTMKLHREVSGKPVAIPRECKDLLCSETRQVG